VRSEGFYVNEKFQRHQLGSQQRPSDLYHSTLTTVPQRSPYLSGVLSFIRNEHEKEDEQIFRESLKTSVRV